MKFPRSFRILIFFALLIGMIGVGNTPSTHADDPLTFSGRLYVWGSNTMPHLEDSDWYTVYVQAGETVELTISYYAHCWATSAYVDFFFDTQVDSIFIDHANSRPPGYIVVVSGTNTYSHVIPITQAVRIGIGLRSWALAGANCGTTYEITVSGATLTPPPTPPVEPVDPIIAAEEAAGLQRVQDNALPVVIYTPTPNNPDRFIDIHDLVGNPLLYISADDLVALPEFPIENTLIASTADGYISVYKLTTGEYQVNVGPLPDGKVHVIIFDGIPRTHTNGYTWKVPE